MDFQGNVFIVMFTQCNKAVNLRWIYFFLLIFMCLSRCFHEFKKSLFITRGVINQSNILCISLYFMVFTWIKCNHHDIYIGNRDIYTKRCVYRHDSRRKIALSRVTPYFLEFKVNVVKSTTKARYLPSFTIILRKSCISR